MNYRLIAKRLLSPILLLIVPIYYFCFLVKKYFDLKKQFKSLHTKIVCVGNYTLGGTGKTVIVKKLVEDLMKLEKKVAIITRGYKRKKRNRRNKGNGTREDITKISTIILNSQENYHSDIVKICGDEPFMLFNELRVPIGIGGNRCNTIKSLVEKYNSDIIISDDGYQNFTFYKDINVLVVNMLNPFGKKMLFPFGDLREPIKLAVSRANYIILNHCNLVSEIKINRTKIKLLNYNDKLKIIETYYKIKCLVKVIENRRYEIKDFLLNNNSIILCTGVAEPRTVEQMMLNEGFKIEKKIFYPDHYWYTKKDIIKLSSYDLPVILTQKDIVKIIPLKSELEDIYFKNLYSTEIELVVKEGQNLWTEIINSV